MEQVHTHNIDFRETLHSPWFQTSAAILIIYTLFSGITQRRLVILYRRFFLDFLAVEDGTGMLSRNVGKIYHSTLCNIAEDRISQLYTGYFFN
jgi:hypothetical protein